MVRVAPVPVERIALAHLLPMQHRLKQQPTFQKCFLRPSVKQLPWFTLLVAVTGAIQGPPVALLLGWLLGIEWRDVYTRPEHTHLLNCIPGAVYSICAYLIGSVALEAVRPRFRGSPPVAVYAASVAASILSVFAAGAI